MFHYPKTKTFWQKKKKKSFLETLITLVKLLSANLSSCFMSICTQLLLKSQNLFSSDIVQV